MHKWRQWLTAVALIVIWSDSTCDFSLRVIDSVYISVSELIDRLNKAFVLWLEKTAKNTSNWVSSQTFLAGRICSWPFNLLAIHHLDWENVCIYDLYSWSIFIWMQKKKSGEYGLHAHWILKLNMIMSVMRWKTGQIRAQNQTALYGLPSSDHLW